MQRGKYVWKRNRSDMWTWFDGDRQASGASRTFDDANEIFESNCLKDVDREQVELSFSRHPEFARLDNLYTAMTEPELSREIERMARDIASNQHAGRREFNGNGGRRTSAAVASQAARDIGQEKLLAECYRQHKFPTSL